MIYVEKLIAKHYSKNPSHTHVVICTWYL